MKPYFELSRCVRCEAKYIEDCPKVIIELGTGKPLLPEGCWRIEQIKTTQKLHKNKDV